MCLENNEPLKLSAVDRVVDEIINEIITGKLFPGRRLATEPELAARYGVGRNSVREAIKQLQGFGILHIRRADGTYVADSYNQKMLDPLLYSLILQNRDWDDFVQLRSVVDIGTLSLVLKRSDCDNLAARLEHIWQQLAEEVHGEQPSAEEILRLDLAFHHEIIQALQNPQVDSVYGYVMRLTVPSRRRSVQRWLISRQEDQFLALHRQFIDLIKNKNSAAIEAVVEEHYVYWK